MAKSVSDQIVEELTKLDVKHIFGIPGDTIDSMMESLRNQKEIEFIIMRHEETGAFAASAQAKLTGKLAVCVACQGPGAIHLLNGLYDAAMDKVPVLAITGQVATDVIGTGMPQEVNQIMLFEKVAVFNEEVRSAEQIPAILAMACREAIKKKGVAHISIPADIMNMKAVETHISSILVEPSTTIPPDNAIVEATEILNKAKSVGILYGGGSIGCADELIALSEKLNAPLVHTTRSKDIVDNHHENYVGGIGFMGTRAGNHGVNACDTLLVAGSSFAFKEFYPKNVPIIQIDDDAARIGAHVPVTLGLLGSCKPTLKTLLARVEKKTDDSFLRHTRTYRDVEHDVHEIAAKPSSSKTKKFVNPKTLIERLGQLADDDAIFTVGSGSVTLYCNHYLHLNGKQRFLWTWNLASLGWTLPAALGCKLRAPERQVIAPVGDGDFQMLIADLITFAKYKVPVTFIIFNNSSYHFIELEEASNGNPPFGTHFLNPDYIKLAEAHGLKGIKLDNDADIDSALKEALASDTTTLLDVAISPDEIYIPPCLTPEMVVNFAKSKIRAIGW